MASPPPGPSDPELERVATGMATWLPRMARRARQAVLVVAAFAGLTGTVALVLGVTAWHDSVAQAMAVLVVTLPAVVAPVMTARRMRPLTAAVAHPDETARQARSYFATATRSVELDELVARAATIHQAGDKVRLGGIWRTSRLVGAVIGRVRPDPDIQPLLAAFSPTNLRAVWLGVIVSWWLWLVALFVALAAGSALTVDLVT
jgi:hypothetical protein